MGLVRARRLLHARLFRIGLLFGGAVIGLVVASVPGHAWTGVMEPGGIGGGSGVDGLSCNTVGHTLGVVGGGSTAGLVFATMLHSEGGSDTLFGPAQVWNSNKLDWPTPSDIGDDGITGSSEWAVGVSNVTNKAWVAKATGATVTPVTLNKDSNNEATRSWGIEQAFDTTSGTFSNLDVTPDASGLNPTVLYDVNNSGTSTWSLKYAAYVGVSSATPTGWASTTLASSPGPDIAGQVLSVGRQISPGRYYSPVAVYKTHENMIKVTDLEYSANPSFFRQYHEFAIPGVGVVSYPVAAADPAGNLYIAYQDRHDSITDLVFITAPNDASHSYTRSIITTSSPYRSLYCTDYVPYVQLGSRGDDIVMTYMTTIGPNFDKYLAYKVYFDGTWSEEQLVPAVGDPWSGVMMAEHGYKSQMAVEYSTWIDGSTRVVFASLHLPPTLSASLYPSTISPTAGTSATLSLTANEPVTVSAQIRNDSGAIVDTGTCGGGFSLSTSCSWDGKQASGGSRVAVPEGAYTFSVSATNSSTAPEPDGTEFTGGTFTRTVTKQITVDITPPQIDSFTIDTTNGSGWTNSTSVTTHWSGQDPVVGGVASGVYFMSLSNTSSPGSLIWPGCTSTCSNVTRGWTLPTGDGQKTVHLFVTDLAGNVTNQQVNVGLDTALPGGTISIRGLVNGTYTNNRTVTFDLTQTDPGTLGVTSSGAAKIKYYCPTVGWSPLQPIPSPDTGSCTLSPTASDGWIGVAYSVQDAAGNLANLPATGFRLDTTPPVVTPSLPTTADRDFTVSWSATDSASGIGVDSYDVEVKRSDEASFTPLLSETNSTSTNYEGVEPYSYTFQFRARDLLGNFSQWVQLTVEIDYPDLTVEQLGDQAIQPLCNGESPAADLGSTACALVQSLLGGGSVPPPPPPPPWGPEVGTIALISSGIDCVDLPAAAQERIANCATLSDATGYGTWAASVILQANSSATVQSFNVFPAGSKRASDTLLAQALGQIQAQGGFNSVLLAFPPRDVLDPTSWALNQPFAGGSAANNLGSLWDVATQALVDHPYDANGINISALPLDAGLRSTLFSGLNSGQRGAIDALAKRAGTWRTIRDKLRAINAVGTPVIMGAGEGGSAPTQSIVGLAALPEVITVGPAYKDGTTHRLSPASARGPAPDLTLKPDFLAESEIAGLVPSDSPLQALPNNSLSITSGLLSGYNTGSLKPVNGGWSIPAAALTAVYAADLVGEGVPSMTAANRVAVVRGLLQTLASLHPALKPTGTNAAAPWEQGAGVLYGSDIPAAGALSSVPIPISRTDIGQVPVGGSSSVDIDWLFRSGGATNADVSTGAPTSMSYLGPNDGGLAIETTYGGTNDVSVSNPSDRVTHIAATSGAGNDDVFQGGLYCFQLSSPPYSWPSCVLRDMKATFRSDYLFTSTDPETAGERTEDETFILTPGLPLEVGVLGGDFKYVPLDPMFVPLGVGVTDNNGSTTFNNVPPGFYRLMQLASYSDPGTYSNVEDPTLSTGYGTSVFLRDLWVYKHDSTDNANVWENTATRTPPPSGAPPGRFGAAVTHDPIRGRTVYFGGQDANGAILNDTWEWDGTNWDRKTPTVSPTARVGAAMYFDPRFNLTILSGGKDANGNYLDDGWSYNGSTWGKMTLLHNFTPRAFASIAYDSVRNMTIMFGGENAAGPMPDTTWLWDGTQTNGWVAGPSGPASRSGHGMDYDVARSVTVMFGGKGAGGLLGDTWELKYDSTLLPPAWAWSQKTFTGTAPIRPSPPKGFAQMAYVPTGGPAGPASMLIEYTRGYLQQWAYDGAWTRVRSSDPSALFPSSRMAGALAYDRARGQMVLFGGIAPKARVMWGPNASSRFIEIPARTPCSVVATPLGPLTGSEQLPNAGDIDLNSSSCVDSQKLYDQWGSQTTSPDIAQQVEGDTFCPLTLATGAGPVKINAYCGPTSIAVPEAVMTRYTDLVHAADWDYCGIELPSSASGKSAEQIVASLQKAQTCQAPAGTQTSWTYAQNGQNCDPNNGDADVSATYGFRSPTDTSNPDLMLGVLHYRFTIPEPNFYANLRVNLSYDLNNAQIAVVATTDDPDSGNFGPPAESVVVPQTPQVTIKPAGSISASAQGSRGTVSTELELWPLGATFGDLYIVFTPTTWVGPVSNNLATATVCKPSIELATFAKVKPSFTNGSSLVRADVNPNGDLFTRQLPGPAAGPYPSWTRESWNPSANNGLGAWLPLATETESIQVDYQVPRDWDPSVKHTAGKFAYPSDLLSGNTPASLRSAFPPGQLVLYDPDEGVKSGRLLAGAANTAQDVDDLLEGPVTAPTLWSTWKANGRFTGLWHVPDEVVRANPSMDLKITKADADAPSWNYQGRTASPGGNRRLRGEHLLG